MSYIFKGADVLCNPKYSVSEEGDFEDFDFVKCKLKNENAENTVMFLAFQINQSNNESSS
jgi:hypothetical protein